MESSQLGSQSWNWSNLNTPDIDNEEDDIALPILNKNKNNPSNDIPASQRAPPSGQDTTDQTSIKEEDGLQEEEEYDDNEPWEISTSEIASISSEELHETRPNRWKGHPNTWRKWTKTDRDAWASIEGVLMNDLGVHLYNAFALKRDARAEIEKMKTEAEAKGKVKKAKRKGKGKGKGKAQLREEEGEGEQSVAPRSGQKEVVDEEDPEDTDMYSEGSASEAEKPWTPPKSWTAWPNYERGYERLGNGQLMAGIGGRFEAETIKRKEDWFDKLPGRNLEEEISAGILRAAKERFYRRLARWKKRQEEEEAGAVEDGDEEEEEVRESVETEVSEQTLDSRAQKSRSPSWGLSEVSETERAYTSGDESHDSRGRSPGESPPRKRKRSPSYEPTLMADDELAYEMVRPATLQIMKKLDNTLKTLHNSRVASFRVKLPDDHVTDADTNTEGLDTDDEYSAVEQSPPRTLKKTGRPRKAAPAYYEKPRSGSRGRPRKIHIPLEGETEEEMRVRIARQQKRRLPDTYFDSSDRGTSRSRSRSRSVASRGRSKEGKKTGGRGRSVSRGSRPSSVASPGTPLTEHRRKRIRKLPLRNWRHVLGAAALAGFEPDVIARATQRCAALFGQEMTINTLHEVPAADTSRDWVETATYTPGGVVKRKGPQRPQRLSSDKMDELRGTQTLSSDTTEEAQEAQRSISPLITTPSTPKENTRLVGGPHKCPQRGCLMALKGFNKHWNLRRHVQKQHPGVPIPEMPSLAGSRAGSTVSLRSSMDAVSPAPEEGEERDQREQSEIQTEENQDQANDGDGEKGSSEVDDKDGNESEVDEDVAEVSDGDD